MPSLQAMFTNADWSSLLTPNAVDHVSPHSLIDDELPLSIRFCGHFRHHDDGQG